MKNNWYQYCKGISDIGFETSKMNTSFFDLAKRNKMDILSELLSDFSREGIISKKEHFTRNRLIENSPSKKPQLTNEKKSAGAGKSPAGKGLQKTKIKSTFSLSQEAYIDSGKAQKTIHSLVPENLQSKIFKSYIVNASLDIV